MATPQYPGYVDVIVPVFNEEDILVEFHRRITALGLPLNLLYIDNCSTDHSAEIIATFPDVRMIRHDRNEGYGGSILDGIANSSNDKIIIIDADCEYPPEALPELLAQLETADVVYTSRFLEGRNQFMPFTKRLGNQLLTRIFNLLFQQKLTDLYTGCKGLNRSALRGISLQRKGFEHVLELGVKLAKRKIVIQEIAVDFSPRSTGEAKMKHISETLKYLYLIVFYFLTER
ncbi:MAG: glycosyltransferase family 2 protein [Desulforhopalus sp.]|nr:glycosyltransferase family 2 protein [Desulforhopalus sp.]